MAKLPTQVVGNIGLYYVCYQLSLRGWNVMPTARNARGVDIIAYDRDATTVHTIQVKALSSARTNVPLGKTLKNALLADFFIVVTSAANAPECYVLTPYEVEARATLHGNEYWLHAAEFIQDALRDAWNRITAHP